MNLRTISRFILVFALVAVSLYARGSVYAHQDPALCNASGLQEFPSIDPATEVYDGSTLTYAVTYVNADPDGAGPIAPCNVSGANATATLPDGTVINVLTNATLNVGDVISCPGDAECAAGPYTYTVNHADEDGNGDVIAGFHIGGVLHQNTSDSTSASDTDDLSSHVIHPSTRLTKTPSATQVLAGTEVTYTYTEENDGDVVLTAPSISDDMCAPVVYDSGDTNLDGMLDPGETWTFTCSMTINSDTTNVATGHGTDPLGNDVTWCADTQNPGAGVFCDQDERAEATVTVANPTTVVTIFASATEVVAGSTVTLTVTEENDGNVDLTNVYVDVDNGVGTLDDTHPNFSGDDGDGVLEPGETWMWTVDVTVNAMTTYTATGHGTDPFGNDVTYPADPEEQDAVTVDVTELGCTLTQGYWKTHSEHGPAAHPDDTWDSVGGPDAVFYLSGMSWLEVFNKAPKGNAYYNLAHQYMASVLNVNSGASTTPAVDDAMSDALGLFNSYTPAQVAALSGNDPIRQQFLELAGVLGGYNEGATGPGHCEE